MAKVELNRHLDVCEIEWLIAHYPRADVLASNSGPYVSVSIYGLASRDKCHVERYLSERSWPRSEKEDAR